jgi:hypothetical protein
VQSQAFSSGRIRLVTYERRDQCLTLTWENKTITAYQPVPEEIYQRLSRAPNPATYFEDRVAEEYPQVTPKRSSQEDDARKKLNDLFDL